MLERLAARPEHFPGALLLTGESPDRLESEGRRLAAILLCPGNDPERRCDSCRRVASALHPDLLLVAPEGPQIRVDRIRDAVAFGTGRPYESARRVAVVTRADKLGLEAGNALLKSLEEPGRSFHWILTTTRPEELLATIRSRCAVAPVASLSHAQRLAAWRSRGFSEQDAADLALLSGETEETAVSRLEQYRKWRFEILTALEAGFAGRNVAALILLAEALARTEGAESRLLAELLADAAVAASTSADFLRHRTVAGPTRDLARKVAAEALHRAALKAADLPADSRRGNRRLHYEALLLELYLSSPQSS